MKFYKYMAHELVEKIRNRDISIEEITQQVFERIELTEPYIHSFINLYKEEALENAKDLDKQLKSGKNIGRLYGIPIGIKDLICVKNKLTTCGSKILNGFKPPYSATIVEKLLIQENANYIGSTNMDEFAMGSSTENSSYGSTFNPWDKERVPGGSSGGSATSVASGQVLFSLGSDTGGSIRCPAAYCGVTGLKPTYGRVSRYGLIAYANSLDQIGPITKCVKDAALLLEIIAGYDHKDSTCVKMEVDKYTKHLNDDVKGKTVGVPKEFFSEGLDQEVKCKVKDAIKNLKNLGANVKYISLPHIEYTIPTYYIIAMSEASSNLARYDGLRFGNMTNDRTGDIYDVIARTRRDFFGEEVKRRILLGTFVLSAGYYDMFYMKALKVRNLIKQDFLNAFKKCDILVSPTMPTTAFRIGELISDPLEMYLMDILTCPINLAGLPALSIPCGFDSNELPIGLQLIGNYFKEMDILNIGYKLEQELNIYRKMPKIKESGI
ncbi:MAG: Asp-tRNA(Asn)/Glu-tRNA(Gln) amidotransferase subunit GatA [Promethearchaeota archaeon]|nr:MAG: Asp-tRNA(Asn)/Glu-tRNA(Gln) amidotransferase subunit GatA [Candidatus Lokiarchaeota archaeon]